MGDRSHKLLAVVVGCGVFAAMELGSAVVLWLVLEISNYASAVDVAVRWISFLLLFVNIRIGVGAKRAFLRRLNSPGVDVAARS